jgi:hypothetical protein
MRRLGFSPRGMVRPSSSLEDKSLARFEDLAMPLFDSLYNFARWLAQNQSDAEDLVQETHLKALSTGAAFRLKQVAYFFINSPLPTCRVQGRTSGSSQTAAAYLNFVATLE